MARRSRRKSQQDRLDPATRNFEQAAAAIRQHPMFTPLWMRADVHRKQHSRCPADGWAQVTSNGAIHVHPTRRATPEEWTYVLAHCLLHLGLEHFQTHENQRAWNTACDCVVARFLSDLKLGRVPEEMRGRLDLPARDEHELYRLFDTAGIPPEFSHFGTAGNTNDMVIERKCHRVYRPWIAQPRPWPDCLRDGIAEAVRQAVQVAAGSLDSLSGQKQTQTNAQLARSWFISSYPLLGALAEAFEITEDPKICQRLRISVAAVDIENTEILINPAAALSLEEARFVLAHELLHVGLQHGARRLGREPYLWNVACDYVINGWLIEMQIGDIPTFGGLHDAELKGLSAEAVYDRIVTDLRRYRKLATLAGIEQCDIIEPRAPDWRTTGTGMSLDDFCRNCLAQGLVYHEQENRGFLPAGLVEEIRALQQPAIPWEVELARWFDGYFSPLEKRRTYARPSRRQSATPDIPRPSWCPIEGAEDGRTFGVIIDTSDSMDHKLLGKALGAVASYAVSRDVPTVRVVFCDAAAYDQGYLPPDAIADRVKVRGRGGTILQPGITLLEKAEDFPRAGPILIITDGWCDRLRTRRPHAFLLPEGRSLPFVPKGPIFRMR
ncbi:MAG: peptidase [Phycisphaerae bacterium]|jgi:predicted metal-dependent peptidase